MLKTSKQHRTFLSRARSDRRYFWQPSMSGFSSGGGGPHKPQKRSKQELADDALRHAEYAVRQEINLVAHAKSEAVRLAVEAGENLNEAEKRITNTLHVVRRREIAKLKKYPNK